MREPGTGGEKDWVFVSDAHLTGKEPGEIDLFLRFLVSQKKGMGRLVILGDLFEFLFGFKCPYGARESLRRREAFPFPEYLPVFEALRQFSREGVQIAYLEGNHDFFLRSLFQDWFDFNVEVYSGGWETRIGESRAYLAHGDLSNPGQLKYRLYRRVIKNRVTCHLMQWIGPAKLRQIAHRMSYESHQRYHDREGGGETPAFRSFAHQQFLAGYDRVILGHSHFPEKVEASIGTRRCLYINVGDWLTHRSYLRFSPPDRFDLTFGS